MVGKIYFLSWLSGRVCKTIKFVFVVFLLFVFVYTIKFYTTSNVRTNTVEQKLKKYDEIKRPLNDLRKDVSTHQKIPSTIFPNLFKSIMIDKISRIVNKKEKQITAAESTAKLTKPNPCYKLHTFYYPWYGNPKFDKEYIHWNHQFIPHWNPNIAKHYPKGAHKPPDDIGSDFYPELGPYSSQDEKVIANHMQQLVSANIGVIIVSFYPPSQADENGKDWGHVYVSLLTIANKYNVKVGFHIEPYKSRNADSVKIDIKYIIDTYSHYPAFFRFEHKGKTLPLVYIYDSYHTKPDEWRQILSKDGANTIRGSEYDAHVIGLYVESGSERALHIAGFDGFYTYFAANGFTYGSTRHNWARLNQISKEKNLLFIPSIGPGYIDTRVRPWNSENTRNRLNGRYYKDSWNEAMKLSPEIISITSFNEWLEGTQIEKAIPHTFQSYVYKNYKPHGPDYYLYLTSSISKTYLKCMK